MVEDTAVVAGVGAGAVLVVVVAVAFVDREVTGGCFKGRVAAVVGAAVKEEAVAVGAAEAGTGAAGTTDESRWFRRALPESR